MSSKPKAKQKATTMATERTKIPYELLIRWDEKNGSIVRGVQLVYWERIVIDGEVVKNGPGNPTPVAHSNPAEWGAIVAMIDNSALATVQSLQEEKGALDQENSQLKEENAALRAKQRIVVDNAPSA